MVPERSLIGKAAKSVFYEDINEIDIYIEDTAQGYEKLFSILFSRVFSDSYKVEKVFPLGNREEVKKYHRDNISSITRPSLFLIDGDFYLLLSNEIENEDGLYALPMYCIENILIDKNAWLSLLDEEEHVKSKDEVEHDFDFDAWKVVIEKQLFDLFLEYAISFKLNPSKQTVSFPVNQLVANQRGELNTEKLTSRISELRTASIEATSEADYHQAKENILSNISEKRLDKLDIISGKDYLFPLLKMRAKSKVRIRSADINLKQRLVKQCDFSKLAACYDFVAT